MSIRPEASLRLHTRVLRVAVAAAFALMLVPAAGARGARPAQDASPLDGGAINEKSVLVVNRLSDSGPAPASIPTAPGRPTTLILADQIEFHGLTYQRKDGSAPKNVIVVAREVRVSGPVLFNLSVDNAPTVSDRDGGSLLIIAGTLSFGLHGRIQHDGHAGYRWEGRAPATVRPRENGGSGGSLRVVAGRVHLDEELAVSMARDNASLISRTLMDFSGKPFAEAERAYWRQALQEAIDNPAVADARDLILRTATTYTDEVLDAIFSGIEEAAVTRHTTLFPGAATLAGLVGADLTGGQAGDGGTRGPSGMVTLRIGLESAREDETARIASAYWMLNMAASVEASAAPRLPADPRTPPSPGNRQILRDVFRAWELRPEFRVDGTPYAERFAAAVSRIADLRRRATLPVWHREISVPVTGSVRRVMVFFEGDSTKGLAAPTELLLATSRYGGRDVLGVIEQDPSRPDVVWVTLKAQPVVGEFLRERVGHRLESWGESVEGIFGDWTVRAFPPYLPGVRAVEITPQGAGWRVRLEIEAVLLHQVVSSLSGAAPMPLRLDWVARNDAEERGIYEGLSLSLNYRLAPRVTARDGVIVNAESVPVVIEWVEVSGQFPAVNREVGPGERLALADVLPAAVDERKAIVRPEGVAVQTSRAASVYDNFDVPPLLDETVLVTNLLGEPDPTLGDFRSLEVVVTLLAGEGATARSQTRAATLGARDSARANAVLRFLKTGTLARRVFIEGKAVYARGARPIALARLSGSDLYVDETMVDRTREAFP